MSEQLKDEDYIKHLFSEFDRYAKLRSRIASCLMMTTSEEQLQRKQAMTMRYFKIKQAQMICLAEIEVIADETWKEDLVDNHLPL